MATDLFKIDQQKDITVLTLTLDEFMHEDNEKMLKSFDEVFNKGRKRIVLDLSKATYVSSLILASLVYIQKRAQDGGGALALCGVQPRVKEIMAMTNLDKIFTMVKTPQEAVNKIGKK
jgi:anti-anti-sigma factor